MNVSFSFPLFYHFGLFLSCGHSITHELSQKRHRGAKKRTALSDRPIQTADKVPIGGVNALSMGTLSKLYTKDAVPKSKPSAAGSIWKGGAAK